MPRLTWRYSANIDAMDRSRQRINSSLASYIIRHGGHYIRYPDISPNSTFICQDGVHLTDIGNYIFLNTIQGALEAFLVYSPHTFPECKSWTFKIFIWIQFLLDMYSSFISYIIIVFGPQLLRSSIRLEWRLTRQSFMTALVNLAHFAAFTLDMRHFVAYFN